MKLKCLEERFSICKLSEPHVEDLMGKMVFLAKTDEEVSLVCPTERVPEWAMTREDGWRAFRIVGVIDFSLIGILAKLSGGVGVIRVGAATETEMKEAKYRMEDALNATKAAVEEGVIFGGGSAYIHAQKDVEKVTEDLTGDEKTGAKIVLKALEAPLFNIAENAGLDGSVIVNKVKESEVGVGFDAYTEKYVNMMEDGVLDPVKVTRSALQNATSVASTFLTTEAAVADIKEPAPAAPAQPGAGMDY